MGQQVMEVQKDKCKGKFIEVIKNGKAMEIPGRSVFNKLKGENHMH